jgi:hypothetical protein
MASFKEARIQNGTPENTALTKREMRRHRASCDKFVTHLEHETYRTQTKVYKILKQISTDIKKTAKIHGNVDENVFLQYHEKLWNTTSINETKLEWN